MARCRPHRGVACNDRRRSDTVRVAAPHYAAAVVTVTFTSHLQRHVSVPRHELTQAATLGDALAQVFAANPQARSYILDDQGGLRTHVAVFIDGRRARDRSGLGDALQPDSQIHVLQALTGG